MCSIAMPADYEMMVSHSPPIFSHSPPAGGGGGFMSRYESFSRPTTGCRPSVKTTPPSSPRLSPRRPCLVVKQMQDCIEEEPTSPTKLKKKVVFADDKGMKLTHVRIMTEPSNVPPLWSFKFLAQVTRGMSAAPEAIREPWEITFAQPASDYLEFRRRLDTNRVSLENVIVKDSEEVIVGTVKVSNLSFEKEVFLRSTSNSWQSHEDTDCTFVPNPATSTVYVVYDTFSFKLPLPTKSRSLEFCVCFRCEGREFWDNNDSNNYRLVKKACTAPQQPPKNNTQDVTFTMKYSDIFHARMDSWSEFASWNNLDNENPYW